MTTEKWTDYLTRSFSSMRHVPIAYITAMDRHGRFEFDPAGQGRIESGPAGRNSRKLVNLAQSIFKQARERVSTADLNKVVGAAILNNPPSYRQNRRAKVFYATQVAAEPPTIVLKCNDPKLLDETWKRYLLGVLREELPFKEVPIKLYFRKRGHDEEEEVAAHGAERGSR
jgi:GTP-binding protein